MNLEPRALHRQLLRRLTLAALAIASGFAALAFVQGRDAVFRAVEDTVRLRVEVIRSRFREQTAAGVALAPALRDALNYPPGRRERFREGRFVRVRLLDDEGREVLVERAGDDTGSWHVPAAWTEADRRLPEGTVRLRPLRIDGRPRLLVSVRLFPPAGETPGIVAQGVFAFSDAAIAAVRNETLFTVAAVFAIVFLTALLLYPVISRLNRRVAEQARELLRANLETLEVLGAAIAKRDSDTDAHNYRVTLYAVRLAEEAGMDPEAIQSLIKGAFLHDVGKLGIRDDVLLKPGRLDEAEFAVMQTHVRHGQEIIARSRWLTDAADVVAAHHEKYAGAGYPRGLAGEAIPLAARIFAIADVFDALTSKRPYKQPLSFDETMRILEEGSGSHFDPELLDRFRAIARELYDRFSGCDDGELRARLRATVRRYFRMGESTLAS